MGYIDKHGKYHNEDPDVGDLLPSPTSVHKQSDHDQQRMDHRADLVQPYLANGDPNPEFIDLYPEESKHTYGFIPTDEDLSINQSKEN